MSFATTGTKAEDKDKPKEDDIFGQFLDKLLKSNDPEDTMDPEA